MQKPAKRKSGFLSLNTILATTFALAAGAGALKFANNGGPDHAPVNPKAALEASIRHELNGPMQEVMVERTVYPKLNVDTMSGPAIEEIANNDAYEANDEGEFVSVEGVTFQEPEMRPVDPDATRIVILSDAEGHKYSLVRTSDQIVKTFAFRDTQKVLEINGIEPNCNKIIATIQVSDPADPSVTDGKTICWSKANTPLFSDGKVEIMAGKKRNSFDVYVGNNYMQVNPYGTIAHKGSIIRTAKSDSAPAPQQ